MTCKLNPSSFYRRVLNKTSQNFTFCLLCNSINANTKYTCIYIAWIKPARLVCIRGLKLKYSVHCSASVVETDLWYFSGIWGPSQSGRMSNSPFPLLELLVCPCKSRGPLPIAYSISEDPGLCYAGCQRHQFTQSLQGSYSKSMMYSAMYLLVKLILAMKAFWDLSDHSKYRSRPAFD